MIRYEIPRGWITYDVVAVAPELVEAKAAVLSLKTVPYQRRWVELLQQIELKREVAGTSRIEGAEFTERELDAALKAPQKDLVTRSQRQARAAVETYRWIATVAADRPLDQGLICEIHRRIVQGADDDHCPPGALRGRDQNVNFGTPRHRGADGGDECERAFLEFTRALQTEYRGHDPLVQALAAHYHLAAMHPFLDGNGRTARALEALLLQRAGLRDTCFIAMSNYYYDEKTAYLTALAETRQKSPDLTLFLKFALKGVTLQSQRLLAEIQHEISRELFRNLMTDLFGRLRTPKKRVIAKRQMAILETLLLASDWVDWPKLYKQSEGMYASLKSPYKAIVRDVNLLLGLGAIKFEQPEPNQFRLSVRLEWPTEITATQFFEAVRRLPRAKTALFSR